MTKKLHILSGVAGSGKSTFIRDNADENAVVLSSDALREELYGSLSEGNKHNTEVFAELHTRLKDALENSNGDIYYDATNISRKSRSGLYRKFRKLAHENDYEVVVDFLHKPLEAIKTQNNQRDGFARMPDEVIEHMYRGLQIPIPGVDCDSVTIVAPDFSEYQSEMTYRVDESHNSPYHVETLQEHVDMVIAGAEKSDKPFKDTLVELAKVHDRGKSVCRQENRTDNLAVRYMKELYGEHDRYMGHENVGAVYYLIEHKDDITPEVFEMATMIEYHMLAHSQLPEKNVRRDNLSDEMKEILSVFSEIDSKSRLFDETIFNHYQGLIEISKDITHPINKAFKSDSIMVSNNFGETLEDDLFTLKYMHGGVDFTNVDVRNARGLTYDADGNIVTIGFEKFFNYKQLENYDRAPDNFIVIPYEETKFTLIGARERNIFAPSLPYEDLQKISSQLGFDVAPMTYMTMDEVLAFQATNKVSEGFVARNEFGNLIKFKTDYWFEQKENLGDLFFGDPFTSKKIDKYVDLFVTDEFDDFMAFKNQKIGSSAIPEIGQLHQRLNDTMSHMEALGKTFVGTNRVDIARNMDLTSREKQFVFKFIDGQDIYKDARAIKPLVVEIAKQIKDENAIDIGDINIDALVDNIDIHDSQLTL